MHMIVRCWAKRSVFGRGRRASLARSRRFRVKKRKTSYCFLRADEVISPAKARTFGLQCITCSRKMLLVGGNCLERVKIDLTWCEQID